MPNPLHPANRLYNGEAQTFEDAMRLVIAQCTPTQDDNEATKELFRVYRVAARTALEIYEQCERDEERTVSNLRQLTEDDKLLTSPVIEHLREIAECIEEGDYTPLAI